MRVGDLTRGEAEEARVRYGLPAGALAPADARHPLALRLLADVRAAFPGAVPARAERADVFAAHLELLCLRAAHRVAAGHRPAQPGARVRELAAEAAGRVHEAARRCLGPGHGELDRASFEELFPRDAGWAPAVLTEGLLVAAGAGYRFADEGFAEWLQAVHLDVDAALESLVHARGPEAPGPDRLPCTPPGRGAAPPPAAAAPAPALPAGRPAPAALPAAPGPAGRPEGRAAPSGGSTAPPYGLPAAGRTPARDAARGRFALSGRVPGPVPSSGGVPEGFATPGRVPDLFPPSGGVPGRFAPSGPALGAGTPPGHPPPPGTAEPRSAEVPTYRAGVVVRALLLVERYRGAGELAPRLERLVHRGGGPADADRWADRLLRGTLQGVRDARPYAGVLRLLAARLAARPAAGDRDAYGAPFWERLRLGEDERLDLLRRVLPADAPGRPGCLEAVARRLAADPRGVQPLLCRWFTDDRPLPAGPGSPARTTVADAARALLHAHRGLAADDLCEALVTTAHPHADGLLAVLVRDEPAALCRAVDRWAHDDARPARRVAAAAYGPLLAARVTADADRGALRYAALALLARPGDHSLHGAALAVLVHDPHGRARHLRQALAVFRAGDRGLPARALTAALTTHPEPVLAAFRTRLHVGGPAAAADVLDALADVRTPALARRAAALVRGYVDGHPGGAVHAAAHVDRRLEQGPAARAVLLPLVTDLLRGRPAEVRAALAPVLAAPGTPVSRALRGELLDALLDLERGERPDPAVPEALLEAAARGAAARPEPRTRDLVLRSAELLARTPEGAARLDRRLAELAGEVPGFAALLTGRSAEAPHRRAAPAGPAAPRAAGRPAERGPRGQDPPVTGRVPAAMPVRGGLRGHGTLRPAYRS
ncbi:hypothetical protein LUW75_04675 [Streptomyces sp. MRC013]|uniref:hypothetical protein n=1 Tax=Streptomyces sp. MRC013 TaxID=2898276 RepID=UPI002026003E|nr:hypothetical protein LUW75_04675 [Streptomyces sp. MRC013]